MRTGDNIRARKQCTGAGEEHRGYLYDELAAVDPEYVITLTTRGQSLFCEVFDLPRMGVSEMATGRGESGFRTVHQEDLGFTWIPAPHPAPYGAAQVYNQLDRNLSTEDYFQLLAREVLAYIRERS